MEEEGAWGWVVEGEAVRRLRSGEDRMGGGPQTTGGEANRGKTSGTAPNQRVFGLVRCLFLLVLSLRALVWGPPAMVLARGGGLGAGFERRYVRVTGGRFLSEATGPSGGVGGDRADAWLLSEATRLPAADRPEGPAQHPQDEGCWEVVEVDGGDSETTAALWAELPKALRVLAVDPAYYWEVTQHEAEWTPAKGGRF